MAARIAAIIFLTVSAAGIRLLADEPKPLPSVDSWATFDPVDTFRVDNPRGRRQVRVTDSGQLFALLYPKATADAKSVREAEESVAKLLGVRHLDWEKHSIIAYCGTVGRFDSDARLDLHWVSPGKRLEARWTLRERKQKTCIVWAFAWVQAADAEIVFADERYLQP